MTLELIACGITIIKVVYRIWLLQQPATLQKLVESREQFCVDGTCSHWFAIYLTKLRTELRIAKGIASVQRA